MNFNKPYIVDNNGTIVDAEFKITAKSNNTKLSFKLQKNENLKEVIIFTGKHNLPSDTLIYGDGYQKLSQYSGTLIKNWLLM